MTEGLTPSALVSDGSIPTGLNWITAPGIEANRQITHAAGRLSRCVIFAGRGYRAISADMRSIGNLGVHPLWRAERDDM
jgi:hypothetical protein